MNLEGHFLGFVQLLFKSHLQKKQNLDQNRINFIKIVVVLTKKQVFFNQTKPNNTIEVHQVLYITTF